MNIIDLRKKLLQSATDRRSHTDRRKVSCQFDSPEWLEYIKSHKLESLKEERRKFNRREDDQHLTGNTEEKDNSQTAYQRFFLTKGEKKLLQDIYLLDFDSDDSEQN